MLVFKIDKLIRLLAFTGVIQACWLLLGVRVLAQQTPLPSPQVRTVDISIASTSGSNAQGLVLSAEWEIGPTGSRSSFRGISTPDDQTIWISGSHSTVLMSIDGGSSWRDVSPSYENLEFRSIHALSQQSALIASAGNPAVILRTEDAGQNWQQVYRHPSPQAFFDALKFWDSQHGLAMSDPVDGSFLLLETKDGGLNWLPIDAGLLPAPRKGEAAFAASNSALLLGPEGEVWLGTGGAEAAGARLLTRAKFGDAWQAVETPLASHTTAGIFSVARSPVDESLMVIVGGDYLPDQTSPLVAAVSVDRGKSWAPCNSPPASFRSAVTAVRVPHAISTGAPTASRSQPACLWVATGPTGSSLSWDGQSWLEFSAHGFHALSTFGHSIYATGADGRFGKLRMLGWSDQEPTSASTKE